MATKIRTADFSRILENTGSALSEAASDKPGNFKSLYHENAMWIVSLRQLTARGV
jgi:hypothetical protein